MSTEFFEQNLQFNSRILISTYFIMNILCRLRTKICPFWKSKNVLAFSFTATQEIHILCVHHKDKSILKLYKLKKTVFLSKSTDPFHYTFQNVTFFDFNFQSCDFSIIQLNIKLYFLRFRFSLNNPILD